MKNTINKKKYISIPEMAKMLGISRIAVYKKVKNGKINATKIGRNFAIPIKYISNVLGKELGIKDKLEIDEAVKRTVKEYGEVLKLLGKE